MQKTWLKLSLGSIALTGLFLMATATTWAQRSVPLPTPASTVAPNPTTASNLEFPLSTSDDVTTASSTTSATEATGAMTIVNQEAQQTILEKKDQDPTEVTSSKTVELSTHLLNKDESTLKWYNFLQILMRQAITNGLPSNLIVLLILFPMVAAIIAFSRHVIGLRGFGIYTPAVLSVAFLSTTTPMGIAMFIFIVFATVIASKLLKRLNLAHLPKSALTIWLVCVMVIGLLLAMAYLNVDTFYTLAILPLLFLVSLAENFTSTQLMSSTREAVRLTFETLVLAVVSSWIIGSDLIRVFVIMNPELSLLAVFVINVLIGRYNGLRVTEMLRFQALLKKD